MAIQRLLTRLAPALLALTLIAGCDGSTEPILLEELQYVSGDGQIGTAGRPLPDPLVVRVVNPEGQGVRGVRISWVVEIGNATVSSAQTTTNGQGDAEVRVTLGSVTGPNSILASVAEPGIEGPQFEVSFVAIGNAP